VNSSEQPTRKKSGADDDELGLIILFLFAKDFYFWLFEANFWVIFQ
jgi:hypothetical protein